ncbi:MAG: LacI family DNA-binding transcriptional regulator [Rubellimicrobium sp.]|nr:LacI family DNA-binding transcriptional regulator [Rubellimicrobium sp.]
MSRSTIADIARLSGVSTATVDRVLNSRPGVSAVNRQRVLQAARALHYLPSEGMTVLPARPAQVEFFLPYRDQGFLREVAERLSDFTRTLPLVSAAILHDLPDFSPSALVAAFDRIDMGTRGVGIVAVDHPETRKAVGRLVEAGIKVVTFGSDLPSSARAAYVGLDDRVAGRTAGLVMGRMCGRMCGRIGLFIGQRSLQGQRDREEGFLSVLAAEFPDLAPLPSIDVGLGQSMTEAQTEALIAEHRDLVGIYCIGGGRNGIAAALARKPPGRRPFAIMHDLSPMMRRALAAGVIDLVIDQNARLVAEQTVIRLLGAIASHHALLPEHFIEPRLIFRENIPK